MIRCDNGTEYCNKFFKEYCRDHGIHISLVDPYAPQLNGCAERNNRTIVEGAGALFIQSGLPIRFWPYAVETACYILNRSIVKGSDKTPVEKLTNIKPNVNAS